MKKVTLIFVVLTIISFCFTYSLSQASDSIKIGFLIKTTKHQFWKSIRDAAIQEAEKLDVSIVIMGNTRPNDGQEQLNLCETMLLHKPDAIIVAAVNITNLQSCLKKASQQGIAIVDIDGNITKESAKQFGLNIAFSVAADNKLLGQEAAKYLVGQTGKVLILEGLSGSLPSIQRKEGFVDSLPVGLDVVASLPTDWDRLRAFEITNDILLKHPGLHIIFAVADTMAIGAYEAVKGKDNIDNLIIIGIDGNDEVIGAIAENKISASVAQLPSLMAQQALSKTIRYLNGEKFEFKQYLPTVVITQEVLQENNNPLLKHIRY